MLDKQKWQNENAKLPKNKQRPPPQKPVILPSLDQNGAKMDRERMNQVNQKNEFSTYL